MLSVHQHSDIEASRAWLNFVSTLWLILTPSIDEVPLLAVECLPP